jgi:L-threonylcarbamoyladenylate synthase
MARIGKDIHAAANLLKRGELVAIPTETVYGLAGNALDETAITRIFETKNRPAFDPLIVHVPDLVAAERCVEELPAEARQLAETFWPGPLTLLLKKKEQISDLVTAGLLTVGIRCPRHPLTRKLLTAIDFPLAAPSANPFGYVSPTSAEHVNEQLGSKIPYILDGGRCKVGIESTIIDLSGKQPLILRKGAITSEEISQVLGKSVEVTPISSSRPSAPGQMQTHYATRVPLRLVSIAEELTYIDKKKTGVLSFRKRYSGIEAGHHKVLSPSGKLDEAARNLFQYLRELDKKPIDLILAEELPEEGLGRAINDRLRRAAEKK